MEDKNIFLDSGIKYISKSNSKKLINLKRLQSSKELITKRILYIIIAFLIILIIILLYIIYSQKKIYSPSPFSYFYPEGEDFMYYNTSEMDEPKGLFEYKEDHTEITDKNKIRICYCIDSNLVYPTLVSMTSALENNDKEKNIIVFYLFIPHNFDKRKIEIFDSLKKHYLVKIHYLLIPPRFNRYRKWTANTGTVYYKLYIPFVLPHLKRILYLDGDTLVHKDLSELFNLDFQDNYALGYPFHNVEMMDKWKVKLVNYINGGVILFNLEKIIRDNKDAEWFLFTLKNNGRLYFLEQDSLNLVFYNHTGILPLKYGIYLFGTIETYRKTVKKYLRVEINETELIEALEHPAIVHFAGCYPKIWEKHSKYKTVFGEQSVCFKAFDDFYFYANKTDYGERIYKKYVKQ